MTQYVDKFKMSSGNYLFKDSEGRNLIEQNKKEIDATVKRIDKELASFMNDVNEKFAKLKDRKFILMTDSYGVDESVGGSSFSTLLESMIPKSIYAYNWSVGGAGFGWEDSKSESFINIFNSNTESWTQDEKNSITDLYVFGGANDGNLLHASLATDDQIRSRLNDFLIRVRSVLPNCTIHLGFIGWYRKLERFQYYNQAFHIWADGDCDFINNLNWIMHNKDFIRTSDNIHPNSTASKYLAKYIYKAILYGSINYIETFSDNTAVGYSGTYGYSVAIGHGRPYFEIQYVNNICTICFQATGDSENYIELACTGLNSLGPYKNTPMFQIQNTPVGGYPIQGLTVPTIIYYESTWNTFPVNWFLYDGYINWGNDYPYAIAQIKSIRIGFTTIHIDLTQA